MPRRLFDDGWFLAATRGSHRRFKHPTKPGRVAVPGKPSDDSAGYNYSAHVPDLPGCVATGASLAEPEAAIREAIAFHLDGLREEGLPIPTPSSKVEYVEVAA